MPSETIKMQIRSYRKLLGDLRAIDERTAKAIKATVKDIKARAPGWISTAVTGVYNINKSEVTPASSSARRPQKKAASVRVSGETIDSIAITYTGRLLTPTHFGMRKKLLPKGDTRKVPGGNIKMQTPGKVATITPPRAYQISAEFFKGKRQNIRGDAFLATNKGSGVIPFQRIGSGRTPIKAIKTLSVPQMLKNVQVEETIQGKLNEGLEERFNHHMSRQLGINIK